MVVIVIKRLGGPVFVPSLWFVRGHAYACVCMCVRGFMLRERNSVNSFMRMHLMCTYVRAHFCMNEVYVCMHGCIRDHMCEDALTSRSGGEIP